MSSPAELYLRRLPVHDGPHPLGRHVHHDERSREHDVARLVRGVDPRPVLWPRVSPIFDQYKLGACTGMFMAGWLGSSPHCGDPLMFGENEAVWLYNGATRNDPFPGFHPPDDTGSSGLAVCRTARDLGMIKNWSTAFTTTAMLAALQLGPVGFGTVWTEGMFYPDSRGVVSPTGAEVGGHQYLIRGWDGTYLLGDNSWSEEWGPLGGSFMMTLDTWEWLREREADVVVPRV